MLGPELEDDKVNMQVSRRELTEDHLQGGIPPHINKDDVVARSQIEA